MSENDDALLYPRGFAFSRKPLHDLEDLDHYTTHFLPAGCLYVDAVVDASICVQDENWVAVIGSVFPLSTGSIPIDDENISRTLFDTFEREGEKGIENALYDLGGRYAILLRFNSELIVYHDATGTRSVYFHTGMQSVASHLDMLERAQSDEPGDESRASPLKVELQWHFTRNTRIFALLANHKLHFPSGTTSRYHLNGRNLAKELDSEARLRLIGQAWTEQLELLESQSIPLVISMTGGRDSRLALAMTGSRKDRYTSVTYTSQRAIEKTPLDTYWDRSMALDYEIVKKLRPFLPAKHTFLSRGETDPWPSENREILDRNSEISHGRWLIPLYRSHINDRRAVHYRGNLIEIGRLVFAEPNDLTDPHQKVLKLIQRRAGKEPSLVKAALASAEEAMKTLDYTSISSDYDLTDTWYWEVRHSRWYSQVLNETDVVFDSFSPFNVRRVIDAFLAYSPPDRKSAFAQDELTYRANPYLMFFDFNGSSDLYRRYSSGGSVACDTQS